MKLSENEIQRMFQGMTARRGGAGCLGEDTLMRVACGDADRAERERAAAHIARCSDCAREYRIARDLEPLRETPKPRWLLPLAAMLAAAIAGLGGFVAGSRRNVIPSPVPSVARPAPPDVSTDARHDIAVGMPIVDLDADPTRSESASIASVDLPAGVELYTLILHLPVGWDGAVDVSVDDAAPLRAVASGGSITLTLHRNTAGPGKHVIHVRSGGRQIDFPFVVNAS